MNNEKIERINFLARKSKSEGLTEEEKFEQAELRKEYIEAYRRNLESQLQTIVVVDDKGNRSKLKKKNVN
ncbi:MAG: DUF896 domain-containing protein [Erysipelotrichales bacterium]|nr:DUF896 domain-containing protein [Erysipelotrichales bacterium]